MEIYGTLSFIGRLLNDHRVTWGVGASLLLSIHSLIERPRDIDICVALEDAAMAETLLADAGVWQDSPQLAAFETRRFCAYTVRGIDVDLMAGLAIRHSDGLFDYVFDSRSVSEFRTVGGVSIPFASLEDWFVLYQLMPDKGPKAEAIEMHLLSAGVGRPELLERALDANLPPEVRSRVEGLLASASNRRY